MGTDSLPICHLTLAWPLCKRKPRRCPPPPWPGERFRLLGFPNDHQTSTPPTLTTRRHGDADGPRDKWALRPLALTTQLLQPPAPHGGHVSPGSLSPGQWQQHSHTPSGARTTGQAAWGRRPGNSHITTSMKARGPEVQVRSPAQGSGLRADLSRPSALCLAGLQEAGPASTAAGGRGGGHVSGSVTTDH